MKLINYLKVLQNTPTMDQAFSKINHANRFTKAKMQEDFFIKHSRNLLARLNPLFCDGALFDNELDLKFGDMIDSEGNYIDLKVGDEYTGAITKRSIDAFGDTKNDRHFYVCINKSLSRIYIINAKQLKQHTKIYRNPNDDPYIGELEYSKYPFVIELEKGS